MTMLALFLLTAMSHLLMLSLSGLSHTRALTLSFLKSAVLTMTAVASQCAT